MSTSEKRLEVERLRALYGKGSVESIKEASVGLTSLAAEDCVDAMIELAHIARGEGRDEESFDWIEKAERALRRGDLDGHLSLNAAYSLRLGRGDVKHLQDRALFHLEKVAAAGNVMAQETMALHYLHGLNGCEKDLNQFERWIQSAVDAGSDRAVYIYAESLLEMHHAVPNSLVEKLEKLRKVNPAVEKLFLKIKRQLEKKKC